MGTEWHPPISLAWTPSLPPTASFHVTQASLWGLGWGSQEGLAGRAPRPVSGPPPWTPAPSGPPGPRDELGRPPRATPVGPGAPAGACGQSWQAALPWRGACNGALAPPCRREVTVSPSAPAPPPAPGVQARSLPPALAAHLAWPVCLWRPQQGLPTPLPGPPGLLPCSCTQPPLWSPYGMLVV